MKYLFIDIRKSDEVYSKHFDQSHEYSFYNIPMNMIRFNVESIIHHLDYYDEIYIVCQSSSRSQFIKDKYFKDIDRIKVSHVLQFSKLNYGLNTISLHEKMTINIIGSNSFNYYSIMRIIQTMFGIIMLSVGMYLYKMSAPIIVLLFFGSMALYNGLTSTCTLSILLEDYLN
jgi:hypothetical protein